MSSVARTLFEKIWDSQVVSRTAGGDSLLYIDRHLINEVTSPQAFEGLRMAGRSVRRPEATIAVADHNVPNEARHLPIADEPSRIQVETLEHNVARFGVPYIPLRSLAQGIVHVIGPVVPGSGQVKAQAEREGLDRLFRRAGFEWREPGCSMCLGMNPDRLKPGERCASTSNRNFEGRQGPGGRTHLMSPAMAAAAAISAYIVDIRKL